MRDILGQNNRGEIKMKNKVIILFVVLMLFSSSVFAEDEEFTFGLPFVNVSVVLDGDFPQFNTAQIFPYVAWPNGNDLKYWVIELKHGDWYFVIDNIPTFMDEISLLIIIDGDDRYRAIVNQNGKIKRTINANEFTVKLSVEKVDTGVLEVLNFANEQPEHQKLIKYFVTQTW